MQGIAEFPQLQWRVERSRDRPRQLCPLRLNCNLDQLLRLAFKGKEPGDCFCPRVEEHSGLDIGSLSKWELLSAVIKWGIPLLVLASRAGGAQVSVINPRYSGLPLKCLAPQLDGALVLAGLLLDCP